MDSKLSVSIRKWGRDKVASLLTEGYQLLYNFTDASPYASKAKLKHSNGNIVIVSLVFNIGEVWKNGKCVHSEKVR